MAAGNTDAPGDTPKGTPNGTLRAASAVIIGSALEWYDFFLYGLLVGSVMTVNFFPNVDHSVATIAAFATFAIGFLARPLGGMLLANLSDRFGRKQVLVGILFLTGGSSFLMGLLPTYAHVGIAAPLALMALRILQGVGAGAEYAVAAVYAVESGPDARRGLRGAYPAAGLYLGLLLASGALAVFSKWAGPDFVQWGWRIPFLLSGLLLVAGFWIRRNLAESATFEQARAAHTLLRHPTRELLRREWRGVAFVAGAQCAQAGLGYLYLTFAIYYVTDVLGMGRAVALQGTWLAAAVAMVTAPLFGAWADRIGTRRFFIGALVFCLLGGLAYFPMLNTRSPWLIDLSMVLAIGIGVNALLAVQGALYSAPFPAAMRTSGVALGRELSTAIVGGLAPLVATVLLQRYGPAGVAALAAGLTLLSLATVLASRRPMIHPD